MTLKEGYQWGWAFKVSETSLGQQEPQMMVNTQLVVALSGPSTELSLPCPAASASWTHFGIPAPSASPRLGGHSPKPGRGRHWENLLSISFPHRAVSESRSTRKGQKEANPEDKEIRH